MYVCMYVCIYIYIYIICTCTRTPMSRPPPQQSVGREARWESIKVAGFGSWTKPGPEPRQLLKAAETGVSFLECLMSPKSCEPAPSNVRWPLRSSRSRTFLECLMSPKSCEPAPSNVRWPLRSSRSRTPGRNRFTACCKLT